MPGGVHERPVVVLWCIDWTKQPLACSRFAAVCEVALWGHGGTDWSAIRPQLIFFQVKRTDDDKQLQLGHSPVRAAFRD
jgi:hypothetical protein